MSALPEHRMKRNLRRTPEPAGTSSSAKRGRAADDGILPLEAVRELRERPRVPPKPTRKGPPKRDPGRKAPLLEPPPEDPPKPPVREPPDEVRETRPGGVRVTHPEHVIDPESVSWTG